jgi:hypothetical protein
LSELITLDEKLLQMASDGKSAQEMSAATGQPAAKCLIRVREILRERNWATEIEQRQLLMDDLFALKRRVQDQQKDMDFLSDKQITALAKVIESADVLLEKLGQSNADIIGKVTMAQSAMMLRLIDSGFARARKMLADEYPDLPVGRLKEAFGQGLQEASEASDLVD